MKVCPHCSNLQNDDAVKCGICGCVFQQINVQYPYPQYGYTQQIQSNNARVLANLRMYQKHKEMQCLECGYKGLVGVVGYRYSLGKRILIYIGAILVGALVLYLSFYASAIATGLSGGEPVSCTGIGSSLGALCIICISANAHKKVYLCPGCEREII